MTKLIPPITLPTWTSSTLADLIRWRAEVTRILKDGLKRITDQINSQVQGEGDALVVTGVNGTVTVSAAIHKISGTGSLQYIYTAVDQVGTASNTVARDVPSFTGPIFVIPTGTWTTVNSGTGTWRIASPNTTAVVGKAMIFVFDGDAWYGSY